MSIDIDSVSEMLAPAAEYSPEQSQRTDPIPEIRSNDAARARASASAPALPTLGSISTSYPYPSFKHASSSHDASHLFDGLSSTSSPTTTNDIASVCGSSPSTSPESPNAATFETRPNEGVKRVFLSSESAIPPTPTLNVAFDDLAESPGSAGKRARNSKNLTLKTAPIMRARVPPAPPAPPRVFTNVLNNSSSSPSAPTSPAFILPPKPARRKPSLGLSINPPSAGSTAERNSKGLTIVPPTPSTGISVALRHHQSSPTLSIPSASPFSPVSGPRNHLQMLPGLRPPPTPRNPSTLKHSFPPDQVVSPLSCTTISPQTRLALLSEEPTDSEISSNGKPAAYPEGPVCVYDPGVYLYLEPTQEEASEFDVILNVAKEVLNPFEMSEGVQAANSPIHAEGSAFAGSSAVGSPPTREEHLRRQPQSVFSFDRNSPLPIDSPSQKPTRPEYVHIPWDHHTAIVTDLLRLVQLIDERVNRGKRVLIHCQCGVSRSASLIIAYGLYKSPDLSVTEAYDAVKKRSQWIGPNMNLIYQLNEFKSLLLKMGMGQSALRSWKSGSGSRGLTSGGRSSTFSHSQTSGGRAAVLQDGLRDPEPLTAPLPDQKERPSSMVESRKTPVSLAISVPRLLPSPSGTPSSAPPGMSWMPFSSDPVSTREETVPLHAPATNDPPASTPTPSEDDLPLLLPSVYTPGARTTRFPSIPRSTPADYQPSKPPPAAAPQLSRYYAEIAMIPPSPPPHPVHPARSLPPFPAPPPIPFSSSTSSTDTGTGIPRPRISVIRPSRSFVLNRRLHLKASNPSLNTALARGASPPLPSLANTAAAAAAAQSAGSLPLALPPVHPDSSPSILSPREATFQGLPWSSAAIGSTTSGMNDVHGSGDTAAAAADGGDPEDAMAARRRMLAHAASNFVPLVADPRSPAQEGGESIRRSIFDVL